jgi:hypothetical protein
MIENPIDPSEAARRAMAHLWPTPSKPVETIVEPAKPSTIPEPKRQPLNDDQKEQFKQAKERSDLVTSASLLAQKWIEDYNEGEVFNRLLAANVSREIAIEAVAVASEIHEQDLLSQAKTANTIPFRNFIPEETECEKRGKKVKEVVKKPRQHEEMIVDLHKRFLSFPRRVGKCMLFDHDRDTGQIIDLKEPDSLMAWISRRSKHNVEWCHGDAMATQRQFYFTVVDKAHSYSSTSMIPSWPKRPDVYYAHGEIPRACPNMSRFKTLLSMFAPASDEDRCLLASMICSPLWFIPGVARPSWIIDSRDGQGSGKTTLVELISQLYSASPISTTRNELTKNMEVVKKRCVSESGRRARIFLCDNITGDFHCDELSGMITCKDITGMAPYGHGEETRPNDLIYCITANSATVSTDIADRSLYIFVRKPAQTSSGAGSWREGVQNYIDAHRLEIVADIIYMLERHEPYQMDCKTRFREFETRLLQPCCGSPEMMKRVLDHVIVSRQDSNIEEDQARAIMDVINYELESLGLQPNIPVFLSSEVVNGWGRRAINDAQGPEYKGRPLQLVRNLAKCGLLPCCFPEFKRIEKNNKRERYSGCGWNTGGFLKALYIVAREGDGKVYAKGVDQ